jgi:dihydroorotate dehydrogenase (NAD+) catalytic subunit
MGRELVQAKAELAELGVPLIASVFAETAEGFAETASRASEYHPDFIELNISCPNVEDEFGGMFAADPVAAARVTLAVKSATDIPVVVKLSPNVTHLVPIAAAVVEAGADAICAVNSLGPGMVIDVESGLPILANRVGGISGPAMRPIAVRCVYEICSQVDVPVIGLGGVLTGADALEMVTAGAQAVGLGSAVYYRGVEVFGQVVRDLREFLEAHGYRCLDEIRGRAQGRREP